MSNTDQVYEKPRRDRTGVTYFSSIGPGAADPAPAAGVDILPNRSSRAFFFASCEGEKEGSGGVEEEDGVREGRERRRGGREGGTGEEVRGRGGEGKRMMR